MTANPINIFKAWYQFESPGFKKAAYWWNSLICFAFGALILTPANMLGVTSSLFALSTIAYLLHSPKLVRQVFSREIRWILLCMALYAIYNYTLSEIVRDAMTSGQTRQAASMMLWILMLVYIRHVGFNARVFWIGVCIGTIVGFYTSATSLAENIERVSRSLSAFNPIFWGLFSALQCSLLSCLTWHLIRKRKWLLAGLVALLVLMAFVNIIASGSRGSFIALACALVLTPFLTSRHKLKAFGMTTAALIAISVTVTVFTVTVPENGFSKRIQLAVQESSEYFRGNMEVSSVGMRLQMWAVGYEAIKTSPVTGNTRSVINDIKESYIETNRASEGIRIYPHLHNDYINTTANLGVIGLILLLSIYASIAVAALRHGRFDTLAVLTAIAVLAGAGLTDSVFASGRGTMSLLLTLLITLGLTPLSRNKEVD